MTLDFTSLASFTKIFIDTLHKHAQIKKKYIRTNHANFVTKALRKALILRSRLWNIFLKKNLWSLKRFTTNSATFALKWLKKLRKNTTKTLAYQKLLTARSFGTF